MRADPDCIKHQQYIKGKGKHLGKQYIKPCAPSQNSPQSHTYNTGKILQKTGCVIFPVLMAVNHLPRAWLLPELLRCVPVHFHGKVFLMVFIIQLLKCRRLIPPQQNRSLFILAAPPGKHIGIMIYFGQVRGSIMYHIDRQKHQ